MKERKTCSECGARTVRYRHSFSANLARVLSKFYLAHGDKPGEIKLAGLTYPERCNFQKLKYWDLIEKVGKADGKGGIWKITHRGLVFLAGDSAIHSVVWTYRGKFQNSDGEWVKMTQLHPSWKFRPEYAREAVAHEPGQGKLL